MTVGRLVGLFVGLNIGEFCYTQLGFLLASGLFTKIFFGGDIAKITLVGSVLQHHSTCIP